MENKLFIGIDFSKKKFDVSVLENIGQKNFQQKTFENCDEGYKLLLKWLSEQSKFKRFNWVFCGEHTGLYSRGLANFLYKKDLAIWLENPLRIKLCSGIKRAKTDRIDSIEIARYSVRYFDQKVDYKPESKEIEGLRLLSSYRDRLVKAKVAIHNSAKEIRSVISRNACSRFIFESSNADVSHIEKQIEAVEARMLELVMNSALKRNYQLITSIKGIGLITAVEILVCTDNFKTFENARQLACYSGCAPFPNESGTINKGNRILVLCTKYAVSNLANKSLKALLSNCARSAIQHDNFLREYYQRKISEGKLDRVVINNVRSKLIHRIFAVVKSGKPFQQDYVKSV